MSALEDAQQGGVVITADNRLDTRPDLPAHTLWCEVDGVLVLMRDGWLK